jgi:hypothetical protein
MNYRSTIMQSSSKKDKSATELALYAQARVDLGRLFEYQLLLKQVTLARARYFKLYRQVLDVVNRLFSEYKEAETVVRLRREIRLSTKGTPVTQAVDAVTAAGYVSFGTEQLYNAQSQFVSSAYRQVVSLVHPDRMGGDTTLFQLVNAAYHLRDLTFLQELFISLTKDNVFWRCSQEARDYLRQEIERPQVSLRLLQSTPEFGIARLVMTGRALNARHEAHMRIKELVIVLTRELMWIQTKHDPLNPSPTGAEHGNQEKGQDDREGSASFQEIHPSWSQDKSGPRKEGSGGQGQVPGQNG